MQHWSILRLVLQLSRLECAQRDLMHERGGLHKFHSLGFYYLRNLFFFRTVQISLGIQVTVNPWLIQF